MNVIRWLKTISHKKLCKPCYASYTSYDILTPEDTYLVIFCQLRVIIQYGKLWCVAWWFWWRNSITDTWTIQEEEEMDEQHKSQQTVVQWIPSTHIIQARMLPQFINEFLYLPPLAHNQERDGEEAASERKWETKKKWSTEHAQPNLCQEKSLARQYEAKWNVTYTALLLVRVTYNL